MSRSVKSTAFAINMTAVIVGYCMGWWWYSMPQPESADVPTPAASQPTEFVGFIPSDVDLGEQPWYAEVPFEATFANLSSAPVVLADVLSSCGCVAVDAERLHGLPLAPSGTVVVNGTVKVGTTRGLHERYLTAVMDDGRAFELAVLYSTVPAYVVSPAVVDFGRVDVESAEPLERVVTFESTSTELLDCRVDVPWCTLYQDGDILRLMLVPDLLGAGQQAGKLQLRTSDAQQPTAIVPLRVDATSGARLVPPHLFLVGPDRTGRAELLAADGQPLEVVTARTTGPLRLSWSGNVVSVTGESLVTGCHVFVEGADGRMRHLAVSVLP